MSTELFERHAGSLPVLISFPHSGTHVPKPLLSRFTDTASALPDTDWCVPELYRGCLERFDVSTLIATHSRYVVDLNRPADGSALYPGQIESAVCPTETFGGDPIYRTGEALATAEIPQRIERYWRPYHAALARERDRILAAHGHCLIWDAHSIRSESPRLFQGVLPELNLGSWDGRSAGAEWVRRVMALLEVQQRFSHVLNGRFKGGYITRHYGAPAQQVHALQLEIAQRAYLSEAESARFDPSLAAPLSTLLERIIAALSVAR